MPETKKITCISCPVGCPIELVHEGDKILEIKNHICPRGEKYARQEFIDPRRSLTTTALIKGALWNRIPVKVTRPLPKNRIMDAVKIIHNLTVAAPVQMGQILLKDILNQKNADVIATRSMKKINDGD